MGSDVMAGLLPVPPSQAAIAIFRVLVQTRLNEEDFDEL
jgi:hypothetical protein